MPTQKSKVEMVGVADGKKLIGTPTDGHVSAEDRVKSLFANVIAEEVYNVSILRFAALVLAYLKVTSLSVIVLCQNAAEVSFLDVVQFKCC